MIPTVFLLCAGSSRRVGTTKQLLPVGGEPMIRRTIRLVREINPEIKIYMITWHPELMFDDVTVIDTRTRPPQLTDTILFSKPYWQDRNIFLTGDTVYDKGTMAKILSDGEDITIFCRDSCPMKPSSERFTFSFSKDDSEKVTRLLQKCSRIYLGTTHEGCCGLGKICYSTKPEFLIGLVSPVLYIDGTHNYLHLIRPFRDFFIFHIYRDFWKPWNTITLKPVTDNITTDIDTPEEYRDFLALGVV
jgi:hypothetical protein